MLDYSDGYRQGQFFISTCGGKLKIKYLMPAELDVLTKAFQDGFDTSRDKGKQRVIRGRYWLVHLMLRYTGGGGGHIRQRGVKFSSIEVKSFRPPRVEFARALPR